MTVTRSLLFLIVAVVCAAVAVVVALGSLPSNYDAWLAGSLLAYFLSCLP